MHSTTIHQCIARHADWERTPGGVARQGMRNLWRERLHQFSDADLADFVFRSARRRLFNADEPLLAQWTHRARCLISRSTAPRAIACLAWGLARYGCQERVVWAVVGDAAAHRMPDFSSQDLTRMLQAMVRSGHRSAVLLRAAGVAVRRCADELDGRQLCVAAWACARLGLTASERAAISQRLSHAARASATELSGERIGLLLRSFSMLGRPERALCEALATQLHQRLEGMSARAVATAMAGLLASGHIDLPLLDKMAGAAVRLARRSRLRPCEIAHLIKGVAQLASQAEGFDAPLSALSRCAEARAEQFRPREIAGIAAALSDAGRMERGMLCVLCAATLHRMDGFFVPQLVALHRACSRSGHRDAAWLERAGAAIGAQPGQLSCPRTISQLAASMAALRHDDPDLLRALSEAVAAHLARFDGQQIADIASSMAALGHRNDALAERLSLAANRKWRDFDDCGLARLHQAGAILPLRFGQPLQGRIAVNWERMQAMQEMAGKGPLPKRVAAGRRAAAFCDGHPVEQARAASVARQAAPQAVGMDAWPSVAASQRAALAEGRAPRSRVPNSFNV